MRRLWKVISLVAVVQFVGLAALVGYLFASKRLTAERMDQIAGILRGRSPASQPTASQPVVQAPRPETATSQIARSQAEQELLVLMAERQKRELEDRARLNRTIQLDVVRRAEEIERREKAFAEQQKKLREQESRDGFARELEVLSLVEPARARKLLQMKKEPDAVRLIMGLEASRAKKLFDTCKTAEEMEWARRILDQIQNLDNARAGAEATGSSRTTSTGG